MNTSIITEKMIHDAIDVRCPGGYCAHADIHVWMTNGLLRIYSKREDGGYQVALDGKILEVIDRGIPGKDQSVLLHAIALHEYLRRRNV